MLGLDDWDDEPYTKDQLFDCGVFARLYSIALEQPDSIFNSIEDMVAIITSKETSATEKNMALSTLAEIFYGD